MISGGSGPGSAVDSMRPDGGVWPDERKPGLYLAVGDVVEVSSPSIGTLLNHIVAK
jgi:hypothetical protein